MEGNGGGGSRHFPQPQHSQLQVKSERKADRFVPDYRCQRNLHLGVKFLFECGVKIEASATTIATAASIFHKFFKVQDPKNYDIYLIAATSLYLAGKVENQKHYFRDIANVAISSIHHNNTVLEDGHYYTMKDAAFQAEILVIRALKFRVTFEHPHKYLTHYLNAIDCWIGQVESYKIRWAHTAWAFLQDFHQDPSVIEYPPQAIAVAAMELVLDIYKIQVPLCSCWQAILYPKFDPDIQSEIRTKMLDVYTTEEALERQFTYKESINGK